MNKGNQLVCLLLLASICSVVPGILEMGFRGLCTEAVVPAKRDGPFGDHPEGGQCSKDCTSIECFDVAAGHIEAVY